MSFDTKSFNIFRDDPRFDVFTHHISLDKDLKANEITWINPATAKVSYSSTDVGTASYTKTDGATTTTQTFTPSLTTLAAGSQTQIGGGSYFNASSDLHYFDVYLGSDFKAAMYSSGIEMSTHTEQLRGPLTAFPTGATNPAPNQGSGLFIGVGCIAGNQGADNFVLNVSGADDTHFAVAVDTAGGVHGSSEPWHPIAGFFQTFSLLQNQQQQVLEQYVNVGTVSPNVISKTLLKYKKEALENNDLTFNTPCIESAFDTSTGLSPESATRSNWNSVGYGVDAFNNSTSSVGYNNVRAKNRKVIIPFSDFFESMEMEGILLNSNRYRFQFTMNTPDKVAFNTSCHILSNNSSGGTAPYFVGKKFVFVDEMRIISDCARMQPVQAIDASSEVASGRVENIGWCQNYGVNLPYTPGQQLVLTAQRDVQSIILGVPALGNKVKSDSSTGINPTQFYNGLLSYLQPQYGNDIPFKTPLKLSQSTPYNVGENVNAYYMYRKCCNSEKAHELPCAINFSDFKTYHLYYMPIYSPLSIHRNNDPKDIRIDTSAPSSSSDPTYGVSNNVFVIARKFMGAQLLADGSVTVMSQ